MICQCDTCAEVVCAIRNEPYNTLHADIDGVTLLHGVYAAVEPDGPAGERVLV